MKKKITKTKSKKNAKKPELIKKNMTFGEIIIKYPAAAGILFERGMHCIGGGMAVYETLEQGAMMHGMNANKLVDELNKKLSKKK